VKVEPGGIGLQQEKVRVSFRRKEFEAHERDEPLSDSNSSIEVRSGLRVVSVVEVVSMGMEGGSD